MNNDNLIPFSKLTEKEQREIAKKGGKKSAEVRQAKKHLKELLGIALQCEEPNSGLTYAMAIVTALIDKAKKGDVRAFEVIRDTIGEKPTNKVEMNTQSIYQPVIVNADEEADELRDVLKKFNIDFYIKR